MCAGRSGARRWPAGRRSARPGACRRRQARRDERTSSGRWLIAHAARLADASGGSAIAVILEPAQPAEIAPVIVRAYNLTERERDVVQQVIRGLSTNEIAELLRISANTVQDHLKAIFEKVAVRSRRALASKVWAQQYWPRVASSAPLDAHGAFQEQL